MVAQSRWPPDALERAEVCPVCGHSGRRLLQEGLRDLIFDAPGEWNLYACAECGSGYLDPRPTEAEIGRAYERYFGAERSASTGAGPTLSRLRVAIMNGYLNGSFGYALEPASRLGRFLVPLMPKRRMRVEWSVRHLRRPQGSPRLLDVGCGTGEFLVRMRDAGWEVRGIEPHLPSAAVAREAGVEVDQVSLEQARFEERSFHAITLNHVIEHLHDPRGAVARCRELLRPRGTLWIATPNIEALGHLRFGPHWFGLDPPRHLVLFTGRSLERLIREEGFADSRRLRAYRAEVTYPPSSALARGEDLPGPGDALPRAVRRSIRLADLRTFLRPDRTEELVVMATAPAAGEESGRLSQPSRETRA
jgi:SAM-dependent methyltransferase